MLLISLFALLFTLSRTSQTFTDIYVNNMTPTQGIIIKGAASYNIFGYCVQSIGDFNDDGSDDVAIGAYAVNSYAGAVYVIFGSKNGLSDLTAISNLGPGQGIVINGINPNDRLGFAVSYAGDVNDDGIDDLLMGADSALLSKGQAYVIYGSKNPPAVINLAQGLSLNQGFMINGASASNYLGTALSWAGDINKDGIDDIIVGAYGADSAKGAAYIIFGKKGTRNTINIASGLTSSEGFAILGANSIDGIGSRVSHAGDFDGDGIDDIIVTAYGTNLYTGAAYIIYGKDGSTNTFSTIDLTGGLPLSQGFKIAGASQAGQLGAAVGSIGDFNGDGRSDVIIAAPQENSNEGRVYVILGRPRNQLSHIDLSQTIDSSRCIRLKRTISADNLGYSVNGAGDFNDDGIDDIIVGTPGADIGAGRVFVIFGSRNFGAEISLDNGLTPQAGFTIIGDLSGDYLGFSVSRAGDLNGDGMTDLIVGAAGVDSSAGATYIFFGELVCPENCLNCEIKDVCLTCETGYGLFNNKCVVCPASTELTNGVCVTKNGLTKPTQISQGMFDSGSTASRIFTMGRSLSVGLGLIAKIIQNVRFLNISYPAEALNAFETYGTDLFELPIPEILYETPETKDLPSQYSRYGISPTFLENYWQTIMTILISLLVFLAIRLIQYLTKGQNKGNIFQVTLKNIGQTAANFLIIQIYSNLDDVIFYFLLDASSTKMSSASAGFSMSAAGFFLLLGASLVFLHCWVLSKYQQAKRENQLERFQEKFRVVGTLYDDFKDDSALKQSFFGILILRCVFLVLVIMLLQPPWIQASLLMIGNLIFLGYLIYQRPFKNRFDEFSQYFSELTVFAAYLSVLVLAILDYKEDFTSSVRNGFGKCIVLAGIVLSLGGFIIQMIQIIGVLIEISKFIKNYYRKKPRVLRASNLDLNKNNQKKSEICESNNSIMMLRNNSQVNESSSHIELSRVLHKNPTMAPRDSLGNESSEIAFMNNNEAKIFNMKNANSERNNNALKSKNLSMSRSVLETVRIKVEPNLLRNSQENQLNVKVEDDIPSGQNEASRKPKKFKRKPKPADMRDLDGI